MGRTTNQLKTCIRRAQSGQIVFFAAENLDKAFDAAQKTAALLFEHKIEFNFRKATRALDLLDAGEIRFVSIGNAKTPFTLETSGISQALRCMAVLIYDHHAHYLIERAQRTEAA